MSDERGILEGVNILWMDKDTPYTIKCRWFLAEVGAIVVMAVDLKEVGAAIRRPHGFQLVIAELWMGWGEVPPPSDEDTRLSSTDRGGTLCEEWLRSPCGGKLSAADVPFLLLTEATELAMAQFGAGPPRGPRDQCLRKWEQNAHPSVLPVFLRGMLPR